LVSKGFLSFYFLKHNKITKLPYNKKNKLAFKGFLILIFFCYYQVEWGQFDFLINLKHYLKEKHVGSVCGLLEVRATSPYDQKFHSIMSLELSWHLLLGWVATARWFVIDGVSLFFSFCLSSIRNLCWTF